MGHNDGMGPFIGLLDPDEKGRIQIAVAEQQGALIQVLDEAHVVRVNLSQSSLGVGLVFSDEKGKHRVEMSKHHGRTVGRPFGRR